jgi:hypothetical protein
MNRRASTFFLIGALALSLSITYAQKKPIVIQEQGSFAVGGSVITNQGSIDPIKRTPEGQTSQKQVSLTVRDFRFGPFTTLKKKRYLMLT